MTNQHKDQRAGYGGNAFHFEAEKERKSIQSVGQTLAIVSTTIWNVLEKKETTGVLSNRY